MASAKSRSAFVAAGTLDLSLDQTARRHRHRQAHAGPVARARRPHHRFHAGRATYVKIPGTGHDLSRYDSQKQYLDRAAPAAPSPFQSGRIEVMMRWMEALLS